MPKPIEQLLAEPDDFQLCNGLSLRISEHYGDNIDAAELPDQQRTVFLVWHVSGIVGNGGFRYLFEGDIQGDPFFAHTLQAFENIGTEQATDAIRRTLSMFPGSRPPKNIKKRLDSYLKQIKAWPTDVDMQFFAANEDVTRDLAAYIRNHRHAFHELDQPSPPGQRKTGKEGQAQEASGVFHWLWRGIAAWARFLGNMGSEQIRQPDSDDADAPRTFMDNLPHWARVAFAARCARHVYPLLVEYWPGIPAKYAQGVLRAIDLAEQSAWEGKPSDQLHDAEMHAVIAAGAALRGSGFAEGEPVPPDCAAGTIAAHVASAAGRAAKCARKNPNESGWVAHDALAVAESAAKSAEATSMLATVETDFAKLHMESKRGKWTDQTPIPRNIWNSL